MASTRPSAALPLIAVLERAVRPGDRQRRPGTRPRAGGGPSPTSRLAISCGVTRSERERPGAVLQRPGLGACTPMPAQEVAGRPRVPPASVPTPRRRAPSSRSMHLRVQVLARLVDGLQDLEHRRAVVRRPARAAPPAAAATTSPRVPRPRCRARPAPPRTRWPRTRGILERRDAVPRLCADADRCPRSGPRSSPRRADSVRSPAVPAARRGRGRDDAVVRRGAARDRRAPGRRPARPAVTVRSALLSLNESAETSAPYHQTRSSHDQSSPRRSPAKSPSCPTSRPSIAAYAGRAQARRPSPRSAAVRAPVREAAGQVRVAAADEVDVAQHAPERVEAARRLDRRAQARVGPERVEGGGGGDELQGGGGLEVLLRVRARTGRGPLRRSRTSTPQKAGAKRGPVDDARRSRFLRACGAGSRARPRALRPPAASATARRRLHAASARAARPPRPPHARRPARRPRPGSGRRRGSARAAVSTHRPGPHAQQPPRHQRLHAGQRDRDHRHARLEREHEAAALEGLHAPPVSGCACPRGRRATLVPPRMRSAARVRLRRARKGLPRSIADVAAEVEEPAEQREHVAASACG